VKRQRNLGKRQAKKMRNPEGLRQVSTKGGGFGGHAPTPVEDAQRTVIISQIRALCNIFAAMQYLDCCGAAKPTSSGL
jgi:hypothetical protein